MSQLPGPRRPLSPENIDDFPKNGTQDIGDERFITNWKTTPLFNPEVGLFSWPLVNPSVIKKPEIHKSVKVTTQKCNSPDDVSGKFSKYFMVESNQIESEPRNFTKKDINH